VYVAAWWFLKTILHQIPNVLRRKQGLQCNNSIIIIVAIKVRYLRISQTCGVVISEHKRNFLPARKYAKNNLPSKQLLTASKKHLFLH